MLQVGSNVFFYACNPITLLLFIHRKILYVNTTNYNNIDTLIKLIYRTHTCAYIYILNKWLHFVTDYNYIHFVYISYIHTRT